MKSPQKKKHHLKVATNKEKRFIEKAIYFGAFLFPLTTIPQIIEIFSTQDATGVSLFTWVGYLLFQTLFLAYSIVEKIKPLIIEYSLWILVEFGVVLGIVLYG